MMAKRIFCLCYVDAMYTKFPLNVKVKRSQVYTLSNLRHFLLWFQGLAVEERFAASKNDTYSHMVNCALQVFKFDIIFLRHI